MIPDLGCVYVALPFLRSQVTLLHRASLQLKREQFPLELACATTVHDSQGDTCTCIATSADDRWQNRMWSRQMLFTLLTRVERMNQIYFAGYNQLNLRSLLRLRTHWHRAADEWCNKVNLIDSKVPAPSTTLPVQFYDSSAESLPPPGVNLVYILESQGTRACYVGGTDNILRRLQEHNSRRGAVMTAWTQDWRVKACILGFATGDQGLSHVKNCETKLQHLAPVPHLPLHEWIRLAHFMVERENCKPLRTPLWIKLF